jgi:uncharacterized protein
MFVGPFDNLVWYRKRVARLFGFDHALETYKPAAQRVHGYYGCPLLVGGELVGRADLARENDTIVVREASYPDQDVLTEACERLRKALV